jgi:hypothetical protein
MRILTRLLLAIPIFVLMSSHSLMASEDNNLVLLYQSDFKGYVEGCG